MKPRISMITLGVSDLARATTFYHDGLGLPTQDGFKGITFFKLNGTWLALYPREKLAIDAQVDSNSQGFSGVTLAHNVRSKAEADSVLEEAKKAGVVRHIGVTSHSIDMAKEIKKASRKQFRVPTAKIFKNKKAYSRKQKHKEGCK